MSKKPHKIKTQPQKLMQKQMDLLMAFYNAGEWSKAKTHGLKVIREFPHESFGWKLLGSSLLQNNESVAACKYLEQALRRAPNEAEIHNNLGVAYKKLGQFIKAQDHLQQAVALNSNYAEAWCNLANTFGELGQHWESLEFYAKALVLNPEYTVGYNNYGNALTQTGQLNLALEQLDHALALNPNYFEAYNNKANILKMLNRIEEAKQLYTKALALNPNYATAHSNLGSVLKDEGLLSESARHLRLARELNPKDPDICHNLGLTLNSLGLYAEAFAVQTAGLKLVPSHFSMWGALLFNLNFRDNFNQDNYLSLAKDFASQAQALATPYTKWQTQKGELGSKLKIGLVSGDFNHHPVGFFIENFLPYLSQYRVELFAYYNNPKVDALTVRVQPYFSKWTSLVGINDAKAAQLIHEDGISVLIDLSGHTGHNRLSVFAWKPAPIQATWLGYFASTGLQEIDYFIGDKHTLPPDEANQLIEKAWYLPETFCCFTPPNLSLSEPLPIKPLPALSNGFITFGSLNKLSKMNETVMQLWAQVLLAVPNSKLLLSASELKEPLVQAKTYANFAALGIEAERLQLLDWSRPRHEHLQLYHQIDIALDPFPYVGGTTSVEALWMGVPVLTKQGDRLSAHIGESINHNAKLSNWIATDTTDYIAKAKNFAANLSDLTQLRQQLRAQVLASPLFDAPRFAKHFAEAAWGMWSGQDISFEVQLKSHLDPAESSKASQEPSPAEMQTIVAAFNADHLELAFKLTQELGQRIPHHHFVLKVLGTILAKQEHYAEAIPYLQQALASSPHDHEGLSNLGVALKATGQITAAINVYQQAVKLNPNHAVAWSNLGDALREAKQLPEAIAACQQAVNLNPESAAGWNNLGCALNAADEVFAAITALNKALELNSNYAEAHNNLSNSYVQIENHAKAKLHAEQAIELKPCFARAWNTLGAALSLVDAEAEALNCFLKAIKLEPNDYEAYYHAGQILTKAYRIREALAMYRKALSLKPDATAAYLGLGAMWLNAGNSMQAQAMYEQVLQIEPTNLVAHSCLLFLSNYLSNLNPQTYLEQAKTYAKNVQTQQAYSKPLIKKSGFENSKLKVTELNQTHKLKVGIVNGNLFAHPISYWLAGLLEHSPDIAWYIYSASNKSDQVTELLQAKPILWQSLVGINDAQAAEKIYNDDLHILLDLSGHTSNSRLPIFAHKPAPIQAHWLGYFASTGLSQMDYFIGDVHTLPAHEATHFIEKPWPLPETAFCFTPPNQALNLDIPVAILPALHSGYITFGSLNRLGKINAEVVSLWAEIIKNLPNSRLLLSAKELGDAHVRQNTYNAFLKHGLKQDRLILLDWKRSRSEHLQLYNYIDISLDPFPYAGGTTSVESLWMGVPVLTKTGQRYLEHLGESINYNAGLPNWIATNPQEYLKKAIHFASNLNELAVLRQNLRNQVLSSPLFNAPRFAKHFTTALTEMWKLYEQKKQ